MMTMKPFDSWAIDAYADNELDPVDRAEVERLLVEEPEARARLEEVRRQNDALKQAFANVTSETVPPALAATARRAPQVKRFAGNWPALAASLALLAFGAGGGWLAAQQRTKPDHVSQIVAAAVGAHQIYSNEKRHAVEVVATDSDHLVSWLSKRIGVSFKVPDLNDQGYQFVGGRLLAAGNVPVALLMYEDAEKRRTTIYLTSNPKKSAAGLEVVNLGRFTACHWEEPDMVYALVGEQSAGEMRALAQIAHDRFDS
jgi:anti-sigma factor RsiW